MKDLEKTFVGRGEMKGFHFTQLESNDGAFLYQVTDQFGNFHFEVFARRMNSRIGCVSYPRSKAFGRWAFCFTNYQKAALFFEGMSDSSFTEDGLKARMVTQKTPR